MVRSGSVSRRVRLLDVGGGGGYASRVDYQEALSYILGFSDYERRSDPAWSPTRFSLARVERFCALLGRPQDAFPAVHIAGTKGKGSTAAMIHSALAATGLRVGLFTSPHLHCFRERIRVGAELIAEDDLASCTAAVVPHVERLHAEHSDLGQLTTFEVLSGVALLYFARRRVQAAVLETGLGGRLDATNVVRPLVAVITSISLDHTHVLGNTLEAIAREKAGIVKEEALVISPPQAPEALAPIEAACRAQRADLRLGGRDWRWWEEATANGAARLSVAGWFPTYEGLAPALRGRHQLLNAATAVAALEGLRERGLAVPRECIAAGLAAVRWPGRLEVIHERPTVVVDGAHNDDSARRLREALAEVFTYRRLILVLGISLDKDIAAIVRELVPAADHVVVARSHHPRAAPVDLLLRHCREQGATAAAAADVAAALALALAQATADDLICVTGSLFAVAEAREACGLHSVV